jgi:hypothetical protein
LFVPDEDADGFLVGGAGEGGEEDKEEGREAGEDHANSVTLFAGGSKALLGVCQL